MAQSANSQNMSKPSGETHKLAQQNAIAAEAGQICRLSYCRDDASKQNERSSESDAATSDYKHQTTKADSKSDLGVQQSVIQFFACSLVLWCLFFAREPDLDL